MARSRSRWIAGLARPAPAPGATARPRDRRRRCSAVAALAGAAGWRARGRRARPLGAAAVGGWRRRGDAAATRPWRGGDPGSSASGPRQLVRRVEVVVARKRVEQQRIAQKALRERRHGLAFAHRVGRGCARQAARADRRRSVDSSRRGGVRCSGCSASAARSSTSRARASPCPSSSIAKRTRSRGARPGVLRRPRALMLGSDRQVRTRAGGTARARSAARRTRLSCDRRLLNSSRSRWTREETRSSHSASVTVWR